MEWWRQLQSDSQLELDRTGIPRQVLRQVIGDRGPTLGSSILDAGCGRGDLSAYLSHLGFDVTGFDESPEHIARARRTIPGIDFVSGSSAAMPIAPHQYNLVIVRRLSSYLGSMFDAPALRTSGQLLASLRPGGRLIFLEQSPSGDAEAAECHREYCFARHLECFPGTVDVQNSETDRSGASGWTRWLPGTRNSGYIIAAIEIPAQPHGRDEWLRFADASRFGKRSFCCAWSEAAARPTSHRAAA